MKRLPRVFVIWISLSLLASVAYILEGRPRIALWRAGFSHQTYRSGFVSLLRTEIKCSDRNPSLEGWIDCFPRLERLHLVAGGDNSNHFDSLLPFTRITSLRELELAGVSLGSVDEIPAFPLLEELRLYESNCWQLKPAPDSQQLKALRMRLPKLKALWIDDDYSKRLHLDTGRDEIIFTEKEI